MRTLFSSLLAASLLIHAAIGCCWHHAHESACGDESPLASAAEADYDHHHGDSADGHRSHGPCKDQSHCHGMCNYLPAQKSQIDKSRVHVALDFAASTKDVCRAQVAPLCVAEGSQEFCSRPPLRLHLFYQILLI